MTRVCMVCSATLGEKCPRCGSFASADIESIGERAALRNPQTQRTLEYVERFHCHKCGLDFDAGEGGETHGICQPCQDAAAQDCERKASTGSRRAE